MADTLVIFMGEFFRDSLSPYQAITICAQSMEETHPSLRMPLASHLHLRRRLHVGGWVVLGVPIGSFLSSITAGLAWADFNVGHPGLVTGNVRTYSSPLVDGRVNCNAEGYNEHRHPDDSQSLHVMVP
jgi:hypothetical protein